MRSFIALAAVVAALTGYPALAEDTAEQDAVRIEADQQAKAFIFIIDDEPVAMLDQNGLRVVNSIEYGRTLTDSGRDSIKDQIASRSKEAADD